VLNGDRCRNMYIYRYYRCLNVIKLQVSDTSRGVIDRRGLSLQMFEMANVSSA
jgi:hypothetical protein